MKHKLLLSALLVLLILHASATNYYFSLSGSNSNTGTSINDPWKSVHKLNGIALHPGDSILLKKGNVFCGQICIKQSGTITQPIVVGSYGSGKHPILSGATSISNWVELPGSSTIVTTEINSQVKHLYVDDKMMVLARYPNYPKMLTINADNSKGRIYDSRLTQKIGYWKGATVRFHSTNFTWENAIITDFKNRTLTFTKEVRYGLGRGLPYYMDNKKEELDAPDEWFFDAQNKTLMYYPTDKASVNTSNVKAVLFDNGILIDSMVNHIKISNIVFEKYVGSGVNAEGLNSYINVDSCAFQDIGEIGVRLFSKSHHCIVSNNYFRNILGRGISITETWNNEIKNNVLKKIGMVVGYGTTGVNGSIGIAEELEDETINEALDHHDSIAHHNLIHHNFVDSCGYIGIRCDGQYNSIEKNIVDHAMMYLDDGGGIYCYDGDTRNASIKNNFVINCFGQGGITQGIYVDNKVFNMNVEENSVINNGGNGIQINAEAHDNFVLHNVAYGNGSSGLLFADWATAPITNNKVFGNTFVSLKTNASSVLLMSNTNRYDFGSYDSNYYVNPYSANLFEFKWSVDSWKTFAQWRDSFPANDIHSKSIVNISTAPNNNIVLFTNKADTVFNMDLAGCTFMDLDSVDVTNLTIKPYFSKVLVKKDLTKCIDIVSDKNYIPSYYSWPTKDHDNAIVSDSLPPVIITPMDTTLLKNDIELGIEMYPVPVKAGQTLSIHSTTLLQGIEITDLIGSTMLHSMKNQFIYELSIPESLRGIYLVKLYDGKSMQVRKVIIE